MAKKRQVTITYTGKVVFHGGCSGCVRQEYQGYEGCVGCQYFHINWKLPSKHLRGEKPKASIVRDLLNEV